MQPQDRPSTTTKLKSNHLKHKSTQDSSLLSLLAMMACPLDRRSACKRGVKQSFDLSTMARGTSQFTFTAHTAVRPLMDGLKM